MGKQSWLKTRLWVIGALAVAFWASAGLAQPKTQSPKHDVIFFMLDQLRADQLHNYGNPRDTSPNIDALAARGFRFAHYYVVTSWTTPSFSSLHTSLYASTHGDTLFWRPGMPLFNRDIPTLAEDFQAHGYYTAAFVNNSLAGYPVTGSGFDEYHSGSRPATNITQRVPGRTGDIQMSMNTTKEILAWLDKNHSRPFFLYIHFLAPHSPYDPPPADDIFKSGPYASMTQTGYNILTGKLLELAMLGNQNAIARLYQLYDGKIHFVDGEVGEILNKVRSLGLQGNTQVYLSSDHGELLYSHPRHFLTFDHRSLYNTDLHVPFIGAGPGIPKGKVINGLGQSIDTAPTILSLAGLPRLSDAQGISLVPMIDGQTQSENPYVYAGEDVAIPLRGIQNRQWKLILNLWTGKYQLFNEVKDPGEHTNVAKEYPNEVKKLSALLHTWMKSVTPAPSVVLRRWKIYTQQENETTVTAMTIGGRMLLTGGGWHGDTVPTDGNFGGRGRGARGPAARRGRAQARAIFWTQGGEGSKTAIWRTDDPMIGKYNVYVYYGHPSIGKLATNAPFTIVSGPPAAGIVAANDKRSTTRVNFNQGYGEWHLLGTVTNPRYVEETNDANGAIIVDAVRFQRVYP